MLRGTNKKVRSQWIAFTPSEGLCRLPSRFHIPGWFCADRGILASNPFGKVFPCLKPLTTGGKAGYRAAISAFLQERLQAKLDKLKPDDPQRDEVIASFAHDVWLASAAKRVEQIQAVTHSLKPIHPDARGTNLYVEPSTLPSLAELGSHALGECFVGDVVGNAAALDVYKLLKLEVNGRSLLTALLAHDADALFALHPDPATSPGAARCLRVAHPAPR